MICPKCGYVILVEKDPNQMELTLTPQQVREIHPEITEDEDESKTEESS